MLENKFHVGEYHKIATFLCPTTRKLNGLATYNERQHIIKMTKDIINANEEASHYPPSKAAELSNGVTGLSGAIECNILYPA